MLFIKGDRAKIVPGGVEPKPQPCFVDTVPDPLEELRLDFGSENAILKALK